MAVSNPPGWLQNAGATHTAAQMRTHIGGLTGAANSAGSLVPKGGVHPDLGNKLQVTQTGSPSMGVIVKSGVAWVPGTESSTQGAYGVMNDGDVTLTIAAADPSLARIDIVVFKVQDSQYSGSTDSSSLAVVTGTPSGSPAVPTAPANSIILAQVAVGAGVTSITNANITDRRTYLTGLVGYSFLTEVRYTSSGSFVKANYTGIRAIEVEVYGGGGGSGGVAGTSGTQVAASAGGGGGGYSKEFILESALAASETVTIGAAGAAGTSTPGNGGNGGITSFGAFLSANGGVGGGSGAAQANTLEAVTSAGGAGGTSSGGDINLSGGYGGNGVVDAGERRASGRGGSAAGPLGGQSVETPTTGAGSSGIAGLNYGGGAAGAHNTVSQAARAGSAGAAGFCLVRVYV